MTMPYVFGRILATMLMRIVAISGAVLLASLATCGLTCVWLERQVIQMDTERL